MASILISGPAGSGKSAIVRRMLAEHSGPAVAADFQAIVAALLLLERGPDGLYPLRPDWVLPIAEYVRRAAISGAVARELDVLATNSDGDPARRQFLREQLGPGATEQIVDPGESVVKARLADPASGELSESCGAAVARWYGRVR